MANGQDWSDDKLQKQLAAAVVPMPEKAPEPSPTPSMAPMPVAPTVSKYLPKIASGVEVLTEVAPNRWQATNHIGATTKGLGYRNSKNMSDRNTDTDIKDRLLFWGEMIEGVDDGDGWVRVTVGISKDGAV